MSQIIQSQTAKFDKVVDHFTQDLKGIKTGRAKPSLVEDVSVEAYSTRMTLKELAVISAPDVRQIIISPWDKSLTEAIAKGINIAGLNLNAVVDGETIRINIPSLTTESREQLVKLVNNKKESAKVMLRQVRSEAKKMIEDQKEQGGVGEDQIHRDLDELQTAVDKFEAKIEEIGKIKEKELRAF